MVPSREATASVFCVWGEGREGGGKGGLTCDDEPAPADLLEPSSWVGGSTTSAASRG